MCSLDVPVEQTGCVNRGERVAESGAEGNRAAGGNGPVRRRSASVPPGKYSTNSSGTFPYSSAPKIEAGAGARQPPWRALFDQRVRLDGRHRRSVLMPRRDSASGPSPCRRHPSRRADTALDATVRAGRRQE